MSRVALAFRPHIKGAARERDPPTLNGGAVAESASARKTGAVVAESDPPPLTG